MCYIQDDENITECCYIYVPLQFISNSNASISVKGPIKPTLDSLINPLTHSCERKGYIQTSEQELKSRVPKDCDAFVLRDTQLMVPGEQ